MKRTVVIILVTVYCSGLFSCSSEKKAYPTNLDEQELRILEENINKYHGKVVAFDAVVLDVKEGFVEKPFYKVAIGKNYLWVGGHGGMENIKIGVTYRILGLLCLWTDDAISKEYNDKEYFILSFAEVNMDTKMIFVFPDAKAAYDEWEKGKIPYVPTE